MIRARLEVFVDLVDGEGIDLESVLGLVLAFRFFDLLCTDSLMRSGFRFFG